MATNLPLKIRAGIRDLYDPDESTVKVALRKFANVCDCTYQLRLDWHELREEIPTNVLDNDVLVPNVVDAITIFLDRLIELIRPENNNEEIFHSFLSKTQSKIIAIKVHPVPDGAVTFTRFTEQGQIELYLPRVRGGYAPNSSFGHDILETLYTGISPADPIASVPPAIGDEPEEFVDVGGTRTWAHKIVFPEVTQIPRPENLMQQAPLYLRLTERADNSFDLEGHQRSVDLVHDYLKLHAQGTFGPYAIMLVRQKVSWGNGLTRFVAQDHRHGFVCSPLVAIALIEGILGFQRISVDSSCKTWLFQRDKPFN